VIYRILAHGVMIVHFGFVFFVVLGGFLVLRWPCLRWLHIPAVLWGSFVECVGWTCPLTPLENLLRRMGDESGYQGGFLEHYLLALLYPAGLTRWHQVLLGACVLTVNAFFYWRLWMRER
jgi:hypothetical protein